jgi:hypothetical protein
VSRAALLARAVGIALLGGTACAGARRAGDVGGTVGTADAAPADAAVASRVVPDVATLASRASRLAPRMRELARLDPAPARSPDLLAAATSDTCLRVAFAANRPVRVRLVDRDDMPRGDAAEGTDGAVPPLGPACAVRGDPLTLHVEPLAGEGPDVLVRAVVWASR